AVLRQALRRGGGPAGRARSGGARLRVPGHLQRQVLRRAVPGRPRGGSRREAGPAAAPPGPPPPRAPEVEARAPRLPPPDPRGPPLPPAPLGGRPERGGAGALPRLRPARGPLPADPGVPPQPARRDRDGRDPL